MAGKLKSPARAVADIDGALREVRGDEPDLSTRREGAQGDQGCRRPVDLEERPTSHRPRRWRSPRPASGRVRWRRRSRCRRPSPCQPVSPLGKAGGQGPKPARTGEGAGGGKAPAPVGVPAVARRRSMAPAPLAADKLLQPPSRRPACARGGPRVHAGDGQRQGLRQGQEGPPDRCVEGEGGAGRRARRRPTTWPARPRPRRPTRWTPSRPGTFDKKAFIAAVKTAIEAKSPKSLEEADEYKESGKAGEVKGEVKGLVTQGKEGQAKDIETATDAPPDQSKAVAKEVTPMAAGGRRAGGARSRPPVPCPSPRRPSRSTSRPASTRPTRRWPTPRSPSSSWRSPASRSSRAPSRTSRQAAAHADTAPGEYRQQEKEAIAQGKAEAAAETTAGVTGMQGAKGAALAKLVADKGKTKSKDEAKRAEVTAKIQEHLHRHRGGREEDPRRHRPQGGGGVRAGRGGGARRRSRSYVAAKMSAYKKDRYGGWLGGLRWAKDKLFGMPDKVNEFYEAGRELYLKQMDGVISRVADIVGGDLTAAKQRIAKGRNDIAAYVKTLSPDLQKVGSEARQGDRGEVRRARVRRQRQAERVVETLAIEVRRGAQGPRRADRGAAGREQGTGRQGDRCHQGGHQHHPRARLDAQERAGPRGQRDRRHHQRPGRLPRQPDLGHQGRHQQVLRQHRRRTSRRA